MKSKKQDEKFDLSFAQWLDQFSKKLTSVEIDDMEKKAQNNPYYKPLQGA